MWNGTSLVAMTLVKLYLYPLCFMAFVIWITHTWMAASSMTTFECGRAAGIDYMRGTKVGDLPFSKVSAFGRSVGIYISDNTIALLNCSVCMMTDSSV